MRLNKYIAAAGIVSRRKADQLTINGNVKINGIVITTPGVDVQPGDVVEVNGIEITPEEKKVYFMLNKPAGYLTAMSDDHDRETVAELVKDIPQRIFPVGRLDYNTTGLLIMTNDGELANKLAHPRNHIGKTYRAKVSGILSDTRVRKLRKGVDLGDFVTGPAQVKVITQTAKSAVADIIIYEGKNRQVRRMFKAVGCPVQTLHRMAIGTLYLSRLLEGHHRKLTRQEIDYLKSL